MKRRTYALLLALALSASLLTSCAGGSGSDSSSSQSNGSVSSSQTEDQSKPDASTPDSSLPDGSTSQQPAPDGSTSQEAPGDEVTDEPQAEASLSLDTNDFTLFSAGSSHTLKATVQPSGQKVTFTSGNEKVATVDLTATCIVRCRWEESKPSTGGGSSSSSGNSGSSSTPETPAPAQVDLSAFYTTESGKYEFGMITLADAELAANVYPGLFDIASEQCLPYINMMTMNTSEIVLVQVTNSSDVDKVKSILQSRIDAQVEGGAWYPSAIDAWQNNSRIVSNGNYIMMVVHESCDSIVSDFNALF